MKLLLLAVLVVAVDQITKVWMNRALEYGTIHVMPGLAWELSHNNGAAFGALEGDNLLLIVPACVAVGLIFYWARRVTELPITVALGLLLGGAIGNLTDRVRLGHVIDFIALQRNGQTIFPNFNVADSAITVGACLLAYCWLRSEQSHDSSELKSDPMISPSLAEETLSHEQT
jgi:signal peptidase II